MNIRADIDAAAATPTPQPFTAADFIANERLVGHEVFATIEAGKIVICISFMNRIEDERKEVQHIEGCRRWRQWQRANPDWKEQVAAELDREVAEGAPQ